MISYQKSYCRRATIDEMIDTLSYSIHAPDEWRINGSLMNSPGFRKAFSCKKGDFMYKEDMYNML